MHVSAGMIGAITIGPIVAGPTLSIPEQLVTCRGGNSEMIEDGLELPTIHWRAVWWQLNRQRQTCPAGVRAADTPLLGNRVKIQRRLRQPRGWGTLSADRPGQAHAARAFPSTMNYVAHESSMAVVRSQICLFQPVRGRLRRGQPEQWRGRAVHGAILIRVALVDTMRIESRPQLISR
jgi:hypothetical protein